MSQLNVTELDFDGIKQNLKEYFQTQSDFTDYDFEGSALSVLLDALAYNTHYNAILAHMMANESFIDTAIKRSSVVSLAKSLGYTPRSRRSANATIKLTITPDPNYLSSNTSVTLSRDTAFVTNIDGTSYNFYPSEAVNAGAETVDINGVPTTQFIFPNVEITEGKRVTNSFIISANKELNPIVLPNDNIDTTTLRVRVKEATHTNTFTSYTLSNSLLSLSNTSKIYYLEENTDGKYQIYFGDNVIGTKLSAGNVVIVDYLVSQGVEANNAKSFSLTTKLTGQNEIVTGLTIYNGVDANGNAIETGGRSTGGQNKESIDSIRINAPRNYSTQQRAVTSTDYKNLILASNSNIQSVSVWGGETNNPPEYGKIFISLDPIEGQTLSQQDKDNIVNDILIPKGSISMIPVFVDPEYTYIGLNVGVVYNPNLTSSSSTEIKGAVSTAIDEHFSDELRALNKNFYYSKIHNAIKEVSDSIVSVSVTPYLQKRLSVTKFNLDVNYSFSFNSRVQPREIHSTWFNAVLGSGIVKVKLQDIPDAGVVPPEYNGFGKVYLVDSSNRQRAEVGTIDYSTGKVTIPTIKVNSLYSNETVIRVSTRPHDDSKDISTSVLTRVAPVSTSAVFPAPSKNTILDKNDTVSNAATGAREGIKITVTVDNQGI